MFALAEAGPCEGCASDLRAHAVTVDRVAPCAAARVQRVCRQCTRRIPLDGLPDDGQLTCPACGAEQHVPDADWTELLNRLHAVADLLGDEPEGMFPSTWAIDEVNPFAPSKRSTAGLWYAPDTIGRDEGSVAPGGPLSERWRVWVAPAAPMSPSGAPYAVELGLRPQHPDAGERRVEENTLVLRAEAEVARYALGPGWEHRAPSLRGVISEEHALDREDPEATLEPGAGTRAARLGCPSCGATLAPPKRPRVRCGACRRVVYVPGRLRRAAARETDADLVTFVFSGRSAMRVALERSAPGQRPLHAAPPSPESALGAAAWTALLVAIPLGFLALAGAASRLVAALGGAAP
ncbi:MAG: hypothetical protein ABMA64_43630 [Myxococcota bacterium]